MDIKKELDAVVARYNLLDHPFYKAWNTGDLPVEALKTYAEEYGAFVQTVPAGWAGHGDTKTAAEEVMHAVLWEQFANGLGTTSVNPPRLQPTQELVADCNDLFAAPATALGGLYAFEAQQPQTSTSKLDGLRKNYAQLPSEKVDPYFEIHRGDVHEMALIAERLETRTQQEQEQAIDACEKVAKGLWDTLTGIYDKHCAVMN